MAQSQKRNAKNYIFPLNTNGLRGRMLYSPSKTKLKREIFLIYDFQNDLHQWQHLIKVLNSYGTVTSTDLPGFGGMESFYKIHEKPSIDALADYLAAIIKLRYRKKHFTIFGIGYGFVIVTRMLQRYPDIAKQVELAVSIAGFAHSDDLTISKEKLLLIRSMSWLASKPVFALLLKNTFFTANSIKWAYENMPLFKSEIIDLKNKQQEEYVNKTILSWRRNNFRTFMTSLNEISRLDNCRIPVKVPVWHIALLSSLLDNHLVEQHLRVIYAKYNQANVRIDSRTTKMLTPQIANRLLPAKLRKVLSVM